MLEETEAYGMTFRFPARDTAVGASLRDYGEFARPELDFLLDHAEGPAATFVDVGAHIGTIALPFAKARPGWRVIAIEAAFRLADLVREGAERNGLPNVEVLTVAAGEAPGIAEFPAVELHHEGNFGTVGFSHPAKRMRKVGVRPLDDIAPDDTRIVKVDVEGFEDRVLLGSPRLLSQVRPVWLLEAQATNQAETETAVGLLRAAGYGLFWFFSPFATPKAPKSAPPQPGIGDLGLAALPPGIPNRWALPAADDITARPTSLTDFACLRRYGYD